ncbi:unnamed protein product [Lathyrus oleraceus]
MRETEEEQRRRKRTHTGIEAQFIFFNSSSSELASEIQSFSIHSPNIYYRSAKALNQLLDSTRDHHLISLPSFRVLALQPSIRTIHCDFRLSFARFKLGLNRGSR